MKAWNILFALGCMLAPLIVSSNAFADTSKDIEIIAKSIGFISGGPSGDIVMDILFDPNIPDSDAHAEEILSLTSNGIGSRVRLTGKKIASPDDATSKIIFITRGISDMYVAALNKATEIGGLTVSTDETCLGEGCVLVVKTSPSVEIIVSSEAVAKTKTEFAATFNMMITKR